MRDNGCSPCRRLTRRIASRTFLLSVHRPEVVCFVTANPESHVSSHIPNRRHRTKPTPPDDELRLFRTTPTPPDQSDRLLPSHNPSVVGSIPTDPTKNNSLRYSL